jgi:transcriptional regulator with XRE-family HTH domain
MDRQAQRAAGKSPRQEELRNFLRARRARIKPEDVGLRPFGVRRTPGLRREEVATLAGVGVSWYTWLEQGRDINASDTIIDAICRALLLDQTERVYLYHLVGLGQPAGETLEWRAQADVASLTSAVDGWMPWPAYVMDIAWNLRAANDMARELFLLQSDHINCIDSLFVNPRLQSRYADLAGVQRATVARFRLELARHRHDIRLTELRDRMLANSPAFARCWNEQDVSEEFVFPGKTLVSSELGELAFTRMELSPVGNAELRLVVYQPQGSTTADLLKRGG